MYRYVLLACVGQGGTRLTGYTSSVLVRVPVGVAQGGKRQQLTTHKTAKAFPSLAIAYYHFCGRTHV